MIRTATADDLDAITALHQDARASYYRGHLPEADYAGPAELARTREGWARAVDSAEAVVLCAERDGEVAGVAAYRVIDGLMTLTQLHVSPARWRQRIGAALHSACVGAWQRAGVGAARLEVFQHNERAISFYTAYGWRPDPDGPRHGDHLVLRLEVPAPGECGVRGGRFVDCGGASLPS
jgi:ribosomal protein S18 acetylase RimI-like enzyme